jgi:L-glyceraldehyde 3-phosphate reductase
MGVPLLIHQPSYSILNRWIEDGLMDTLEELGVGCIGFSPLAQGMLTERYLGGIPEGSRASRDASLNRDWLTEEYLQSVRSLREVAAARGQTLAQMAVAWTLRDPRMTSTLIGASSVEQLHDTLGAVRNTRFSDDELAAIDGYAKSANINIWEEPTRIP